MNKRLKVTAAVPVVLSGVVAMFNGSEHYSFIKFAGMKRFGGELVGLHNHACLLLYWSRPRLNVPTMPQIQFKYVFFYVGLELGNKYMSIHGLVS